MVSRRAILGVLGALPAAGVLGAGPLYGEAASAFPRRLLGRTGRTVVPLGLGGQASLQHTGPGIDAPDIIVRAVQLGVNYLDSANRYGPSQMNYGEAFGRLHLTPSDNDYNRPLRESLYIASKTRVRYAANPALQGPTALDELRRTMTQMFGDGKGFIPEGAYLDAIQCHHLMSFEEVDQIYEGYGERGSKKQERIGALTALLDYRDGTNYTGLNPEHKRYVRHIGITGHQSSPVLMSAIRRDREGILDTLLVALNSNDRLCSSHQNNVLPLAVARGLGVIAMKIFADGTYYGKTPHFSTSPDDVIHSVGKPGAVAYSDLVRYSLSLPGVSVAIIGTGRINRQKPEGDQLVANLAAAVKDMPSEIERLRIEKESKERHGAATNYFQEMTNTLVQPTQVKLTQDGDLVVVEWNTAFAGPEPLRSYNIMAGSRTLLSLPFRPQCTEAPLSASLLASAVGSDSVRVVASERPPEPVS
jgi:aryl-alcohol dehydrogenase-like predicted oxidoreductase